MSTNVTIPMDLWEEDGDGVITSWLVSDGAQVSEGALIAEVMCEKVQYEIAAPAGGTLSIAKAEEDVISKGDVIANIA